MTDAELLALAALVQVDAVTMAGDNAARALNQEYPMWSHGTGFPEATLKLQEELYRRGIIR